MATDARHQCVEDFVVVVRFSSSTSFVFFPLVKLAFYLDGKYLCGRDDEFVRAVIWDIGKFEERLPKNTSSVLIFPPLHKKFRYFLHKAVEEHFPSLCSFSIGKDDDRCTVVCLQETVLRFVAKGDCSHEGVLSLHGRLSFDGKSPQNHHHVPVATSVQTVAKGQGASNKKSARMEKKQANNNHHHHDQQQIRPPAESQETNLEEKKQKMRSKPRKPNMQLYIPPAKRNQLCHSSESISDAAEHGDGLSKTGRKDANKKVVAKKASPQINDTSSPNNNNKKVVRSENHVKASRSGKNNKKPKNIESVSVVTLDQLPETDPCVETKAANNPQPLDVAMTSSCCSEKNAISEVSDLCSKASEMVSSALSLGDVNSNHLPENSSTSAQHPIVTKTDDSLPQSETYHHNDNKLDWMPSESTVEPCDNNKVAADANENVVQHHESPDGCPNPKICIIIPDEEDESCVLSQNSFNDEVDSEASFVSCSSGRSAEAVVAEGSGTSPKPPQERKESDAECVTVDDKVLRESCVSGSKNCCLSELETCLKSAVDSDSSNASLDSSQDGSVKSSSMNNCFILEHNPTGRTTTNSTEVNSSDDTCANHETCRPTGPTLICTEPLDDPNVPNTALSELTTNDKTTKTIMNDDNSGNRAALSCDNNNTGGDEPVRQTTTDKCLIPHEIGATSGASNRSSIGKEGDNESDKQKDKKQASSKKTNPSAGGKGPSSSVPVGQAHLPKNAPASSSSSSTSAADMESWDVMFDENGDCLKPDILNELTSALGKVKVEKPGYDYYDFQPHDPDVSGETFGHIVEIYDFPAEFKTNDLLAAFSMFQKQGFTIKWVDDTHALGVFASPLVAASALDLQIPFIKVRPLSQAIRESKLKAKRCAEFLQPYKPRPETSAHLARRLVTGALGLRVNITKEQREQEKQQLREARERKKQAAKQKQDVWDGII